MFYESGRTARTILAGVLLSLLVLALATYFSVSHDRRMKIESAEESVKALAVALSKEADATLYVAELALVGIVEEIKRDPELLDSARPDLHNLLLQTRALLRRDEFEQSFGHLFVVKRDGWNAANSVNFPLESIDVSDRAYFSHHKNSATDDLHITQPLVSKVTFERRVFLTKRLSDMEGNFLGVVGVHFNLDHFNRMYAQLGLPPSGAVTVLRTDGSGVFRYPDVSTFYDQNIGEQPYFKEMLSQVAGSIQFRSPFDQGERIKGFRLSDKYPVISVISLSKANTLSHWRVNAMVIVLVFIAISIVLLLIVLVVKRQIVAIIRLTDLSVHDPLTGLLNRRAFDERLEEEWRRSTRSGSPIAVLFIDIDFFKDYNDTYGHVAGDRCLRQVGRLLSHHFNRAGESVFRYGGEEFVVLLPNTSLDQAIAAADKVLEAVRKRRISHKGSQISDRVTVSIGVAQADAADIDSRHSLVESADDALYAAKNAGRDRRATST